MLIMKLNAASCLNSPSISIEKAFEVAFLLSMIDKLNMPPFAFIDTSLWPKVDAAFFNLLRVSLSNTNLTSASGIVTSLVGAVNVSSAA